MNKFIFCTGSFFLILGILLFYRHGWLMKINKIIRDMFLNDSMILLERRKKAIFLILLSFVFYYWFYQRAQYSNGLIAGKIISSDRLLYRSLNHLYKKEYLASKLVCERILNKEPDNVVALYQLAATHFLMNDDVVGKELWSQAEKLDPSCNDAKSLKKLVLQLRDPSSPPILKDVPPSVEFSK